MAGFPREGLLPAPLYIVSEVSNVPSVQPSCHSGNTKEDFYILENVIPRVTDIKGSCPSSRIYPKIAVQAVHTAPKRMDTGDQKILYSLTFDLDRSRA